MPFIGLHYYADVADVSTTVFGASAYPKPRKGRYFFASPELEDPNFRVALGLMLKSMSEAYETNKVKNHQIVFRLGPTPQILIDAGLPQLPVGLTGKVVDKCFFDHGVTKSMLEKVYHVISVPRALYKSRNPEDATVVMSYDFRGPDPLIVAIHPNRQLGGRRDFYNHIASYYFKENNPEVRWKNDGLLLWEEFKK